VHGLNRHAKEIDALQKERPLLFKKKWEALIGGNLRLIGLDFEIGFTAASKPTRASAGFSPSGSDFTPRLSHRLPDYGAAFESPMPAVRTRWPVSRGQRWNEPPRAPKYADA
jgi:hypothetical protein